MAFEQELLEGHGVSGVIRVRVAASLAALTMVVLGAGGCATRGAGGGVAAATSASDEQGRAEGARAVQITIVHAPDRDAWRVLYQLPSAVAEVGFARRGAPARVRHWTVVTPGLALRGEPDAERIVSKDGRPFDAFELDIATYEIHPEKDYQVFFSYTDGGRLVFTGQFELGGPGIGGSTFTFVPRPSEHVVVAGEVSTEPAMWPSEGDGTYAYFGKTRPMVGDGFVGVVDAGMPSWLREPMEAMLPPLFRYYAERTGVPLSKRPAVYLSYRFDAEPGRTSLGGGVLPGVLQYEARLGSAVLAGPRDSLVESVRKGIAHEVAHFWNGDMFRMQASGSADWMSEGSADAFAHAGLQQLGSIDDERWAELSGEAFSKCLVGAALGPLHGASAPGRFGLYYWCGHLIAHVTDVLARRASPAGDLFGFWGELFRGARDGRYDEEAYLSRLRALPDGARAEAAVRALLTGSSRTVGSDLLALDVELAAVKPEVLPAGYHEFAGLVAATLLLRQVSGRDQTPTWQRGGWSAPGVPDVVIATLEGHDARSRGVEAYDAVAAACAGRGVVNAGVISNEGGEGSVVSRVLGCPASFPARPPYVRPMTGGAR